MSQPQRNRNTGNYWYQGEVILRRFENGWSHCPSGWKWRGKRYDTIKDAAKAIDEYKAKQAKE